MSPVNHRADIMQKRRFEPDLCTAVILTLLLIFVTLAAPESRVQQVLGLVFLFFIPGYVLTAFLFPHRERPGRAIRVGFSFGLSIVTAVFIGFLLAVTPWGFTVGSIRVALVIFTLLVAALAWYRRRRADEERQFRPSHTSSLAGIRHALLSGSRVYRALVVVLVLVILGGIGAYGFIMAKPAPEQPFTEFYLLGTGGEADDYPSSLAAGETGVVIVGIANHEGRTAEYRLQIYVDGEVLSETAPIIIPDGESRENETAFSITRPGESRKVEFLLFRDGSGVPDTRYLRVSTLEGEAPLTDE